MFVKYQPPSDRSPVSLTDEESFKIVSHTILIVTIDAFNNVEFSLGEKFSIEFDKIQPY